jgi:hypothetical protein
MKTSLPSLMYKTFLPNKAYIQNLLLTMSAWQRAFLSPRRPDQSQYGLTVHVRGAVTQPCCVDGSPKSISLDLVAHKIRFGMQHWRLEELSGQQLFDWLSLWSAKHGVQLPKPGFTKAPGHYSEEQTNSYATVLWWSHAVLKKISNKLTEGACSSLLLYPHHFDTAFSWYPFHDSRQLTVGFSPGDEHLEEAYFYLTAYPELSSLPGLVVPPAAVWQQTGFHGYALYYDRLRHLTEPDKNVTISMLELLKAASSLMRVDVDGQSHPQSHG